MTEQKESCYYVRQGERVSRSLYQQNNTPKFCLFAIKNLSFKLMFKSNKLNVLFSSFRIIQVEHGGNIDMQF